MYYNVCDKFVLLNLFMLLMGFNIYVIFDRMLSNNKRWIFVVLVFKVIFKLF